jgi:protocatechuate 3,4-dioxygenase beta subunit
MDATDQLAFSKSLKSRIYFASRDGLAIVLRDLLNLVDDKDTRNMLINEVCKQTESSDSEREFMFMEENRQLSIVFK